MTPENRGILKVLWKRGEAISPLFHKILLSVVRFSCLKGTGFSLRDKRLFEISEVEITRVDCIYTRNFLDPKDTEAWNYYYNLRYKQTPTKISNNETPAGKIAWNKIFNFSEEEWKKNYKFTNGHLKSQITQRYNGFSHVSIIIY